jgi:hypothetical protein
MLMGEEKTDVRVTFDIIEPIYIKHFDEGQIRYIRKEVTPSIIRKLTEHYGFLKFSSGGNADYKLAFILGQGYEDEDSKKKTPHARQINFHVKLTGRTVPRLKAVDWEFRHKDGYYTSLGSKDDVVSEIKANLDNLDDTTKLIKEALKFIPIANKGELRKDDPTGIGWVIPFSENELCMAWGSLIQIKYSFQSWSGEDHQDFLAVTRHSFNPPAADTDYRHNIFSKASDGQKDAIEKLIAADKGIYLIDKVYVVEYKQIDTSCIPEDVAEPTPGDVANDFNNGGR